ncbi:MAG TPA: septation protein IspZ [Candidatus Paceibacterota bacterium]
MSKRADLWKIALSWGIEFGPIISFFLTSDTLGFMPASIIFVSLTALALVVAYIKDRRIALFPLVAGLSVIGFGALTIFLDDPFYLIIKDTVYNGGFALVIAIGLYVYGQPILKNLFSALFCMTDKGWMTLSRRWMVMFIILTAGNEVARHLLVSNEWVVYKMGATLVTIVFGFYQLTLSKKERLPHSNKWGMNIE